MGYTHYWRPQRAFTEPEWRALTIAVKRIIELGGVPVQFDYDEPEPPQIGPDVVRFNGIGDDGHETFLIEREPTHQPWMPPGELFAFCKTARKPYDSIVVACLIAAANVCDGFRWSSDGDIEEHAEGRALAGRLELPYKTGHEAEASAPEA